DPFIYTVTSPTVARIGMSSPSLSTSLAAIGNQVGAWVFFGGGPGTLDVLAMLGPGTYGMSIGTVDSSRSGSYTMSSAINPVRNTGEWAGVARTNSALTPSLTTACENTYKRAGLAFSTYSQQILMAIPQGTVLRVTATSSAFPPQVDVVQDGRLLAT